MVKRKAGNRKDMPYISNVSICPKGTKDNVGKFYVVTSPTKHSTLGDILFEADICGMGRQYLGGLRDNEIVGLYKSKKEAMEHAKKLLHEG
jgi:hypothetical protein